MQAKGGYFLRRSSNARQENEGLMSLAADFQRVENEQRMGEWYKT